MGGKGIPESVVEQPVIFLTLTAPSFGAVHAEAAGDPAAQVHPPHAVGMDELAPAPPDTTGAATSWVRRCP